MYYKLARIQRNAINNMGDMRVYVGGKLLWANVQVDVLTLFKRNNITSPYLEYTAAITGN